MQLSPSLSKRKLNLTLLLTTFMWNGLPDTLLLAQELELQRYTDSKEGFTLFAPSSWTKVDKAGATVLFQEANMGSNMNTDDMREMKEPKNRKKICEYRKPNCRLIAQRRRITKAEEASYVAQEHGERRERKGNFSEF
ncbi:PsbP family [Sesbania bispinosa]|nr:PsbP family [Sesbania bispinosa]